MVNQKTDAHDNGQKKGVFDEILPFFTEWLSFSAYPCYVRTVFFPSGPFTTMPVAP